MDKEELKEYLKKNLSIRIGFDYYPSKNIKVTLTLLLENEALSESVEYIYAE